MYRVDNLLFQLKYGRRDINDRVEKTANLFKFENTEIIYKHEQEFLNWRTSDFQKYFKKRMISRYTSIMCIKEEMDLLHYCDDGGSYIVDEDGNHTCINEMITKHYAYGLPCEQISKNIEIDKLIQGNEYYSHE